MRSTLLTFFLILSCVYAGATHLVGGEIFYEYLGNDQYGITLKVYRDCGPTNTNDTQYDDFASVGIFVGNILVEDISLSLDDAIVTDIPVELENPCFILPPNLCVEEAIYYGIVDLPFGPTYDIIYERCCRNPSIINMINPDDSGAIFRATIPGDDLVQVQNNSAYFNNFPPVALCAGAEFFFDHSASDPDADSLSYSFCRPYLGGSPDLPQPTPPNGPPFNNILWEMGYSTDYPIDANPAFDIDESTGFITGTPTQVGQYVIGTCVTEYRNGVVINTVNRDFQFNVTLCDPTIIAAIPTQEQFCDGLTFEFTNNSVNGEFFSWDFGDPSTTLDVSTEVSPTYTYADTGLYTVTLIANPGWSCADTSSQLYAAYPLIAPGILQNNFECFNNSMTYDFLATGDYDSNAEFEWEFIGADVPNAQGELIENVNFFNDTTFTVSLTVIDNGCEASITEEYNVPPSPVAIIETQDLFCQGLTASFENLSENAESYFWDFGVVELIDDISISIDPQYIYPDSGNYEVMLIAEAPFTCADTTFSSFEIQFLLDPFFVSPGSSCFENNSFDFLAEGWEDSNTEFYWEFGEFASPSTSIQSSPNNVVFSQAGTFDVTLTADVLGCEESFQSIVEVVPNPRLSFGILEAEGCSPLNVSLLDSSYAETTIFYDWDFGDGTSSSQSNPVHQYLFPGLYDISLTISTQDGCAQTLTQSIEDAVFVYPNPSAGFDVAPNTVPFLAPDVTVTDLSEGAVEFVYTFGDGGYSDEPDFNYSFTEAGLISVNQTVFNEYGCFATAVGEVAVEGFVIYVPNAFTPNGDGINDFFLPELTGVTEYHLEIFNRWGELIFQTTDQNEPWLGQVKDGKHFAQNEVYQYRIFVRDLLAYPHDFEGTVTIVR